MDIVLFTIIIVVMAFLEASVVGLPLVLLTVIFLGIFQKKISAFFIAIVGGIVLDSLTFRALGTSSFFFMSVLGIIFLYSRKFETQHVLFCMSFTTCASIVYFVLFGTGQIFLQLFLTLFLSFLCFIGIMRVLAYGKTSGYSQENYS